MVQRDGQNLQWRTLPRGDGLESINVVGEQYRQDQIQGPEFQPGARVSLVIEEDNPHDPNAISVWSADGQLQAGYIPKEEAPRLRKKLRREHHDTFVIWEIRERRKRVGVRLLLVRKGTALERPQGLFRGDN